MLIHLSLCVLSHLIPLHSIAAMNRLSEILWRFVEYKYLPFQAYESFENLKKNINKVLYNLGIKYMINFL